MVVGFVGRVDCSDSWQEDVEMRSWRHYVLGLRVGGEDGRSSRYQYGNSMQLRMYRIKFGVILQKIKIVQTGRRGDGTVAL